MWTDRRKDLVSEYSGKNKNKNKNNSGRPQFYRIWEKKSVLQYNYEIRYVLHFHSLHGTFPTGAPYLATEYMCGHAKSW